MRATYPVHLRILDMAIIITRGVQIFSKFQEQEGEYTGPKIMSHHGTKICRHVDLVPGFMHLCL